MSEFAVVIVGAGLASLSLAIQCRRWGLQTIILERAPKILEVSNRESPFRQHRQC
jgi:succinate dehydrogenase/fumarate reductase flavoprotein subunit